MRLCHSRTPLANIYITSLATQTLRDNREIFSRQQVADWT